ncbi:immunity 49 family protein [Aquimarina mytili]|uniref:Immunity 49 family protein n=1 Tax=Aquimarina mytili TaxID=874423 RepID=A0A936ZQC8_9FLAO|nr:immunity 49 family protein [Aquimarina mytili]MBL0683759.1 immunity 49 family protein [Aquimarina mytili]
MKNIALHKIDDVEPLIDNYEWRIEDVEKYRRRVKEKFRFLFFLYKSSLDFIRLNRYFKDNLELEKECFVLGLNTISEVSRLANYPGKEVEVNLETEVYKTVVEDLNVLNYNWLNSIYWAVIARDQKKMNTICSFPLEILHLDNNTPNGMYHNILLKLEMKFYQEGIFDHYLDDKLTEIKENYIDLVTPDPTAYENMTMVYCNDPVVSAMRNLANENEEEFNVSLIKALEAHQTYWGQKKSINPGDPPLCRNWQGFMSFSCTALAARAYDKGLQLEVTSDYMPANMVNGDILE